MKPASQTKILVIGDSDSGLSAMLAGHSYAVEQAAIEDLASFEAFSPDLILLDAGGQDAVEAIGRVRAHKAFSIIPLLLAVASPEQITFDALEAGANDFLTRPVDEVALIARLRTLAVLRLAADELSSFHSLFEGRVAERTEVLERALRGQGELLNESQTARKLLETIFDAMDDAVVITDCDGLITMANHAVADIFNRAPDDLAGQPCGALFAPGFDCRHIPPLLEREVLSVSQERLLNLRVTSFSDAENSIIGYVHVIRDVTRERALERHLMQAERMTLAGMMVSAVAHETATPLSVVANIAEMLLLDCDPRSATADELRKIILAARRVAEMMRNLLGFVRHKAARFEAVDMTQLVGETLELMKYELSRARIEVSVVCAPSLAVWGDRTQLQQVLMNLITNAMQAMRDGGRLTIRLSEDPIAGEGGRMALIVVEDTGHGIPPQAEEKLFDFFFTTKSAEGGTGLGLALTRQIVKGHGGTISAENIRGGARFSVRLPAAVKGAERMRERES